MGRDLGRAHGQQQPQPRLKPIPPASFTTADFPTFTIVIPTYRRQAELCQCLDRLAIYFEPQSRSLGLSIDVVVSDDAADPQLNSLLQQHYPWCRYTAGPGRGPAANRNHGALQATGNWLVFTDDDCLPQPGWIESFARYADQHDVLEGQTSAADRRTRIDQECPINETGGYLWSCNFAIRRELFIQLGGFNEHFPTAAMEDVELNCRINKAGFRRLFLPMAEIKHPWRKRKGCSFLRAKARSIATYVRLHPETAPSFALSALMFNLLRFLRASLRTCISLGTVQGLPRQIGLDTYGAFATWRAVSKAQR
jgi:GT2 family glycosyltransferase